MKNKHWHFKIEPAKALNGKLFFCLLQYVKCAYKEQHFEACVVYDSDKEAVCYLEELPLNQMIGRILLLLCIKNRWTMLSLVLILGGVGERVHGYTSHWHRWKDFCGLTVGINKNALGKPNCQTWIEPWHNGERPESYSVSQPTSRGGGW